MEEAGEEEEEEGEDEHDCDGYGVDGFCWQWQQHAGWNKEKGGSMSLL